MGKGNFNTSVISKATSLGAIALLSLLGACAGQKVRDGGPDNTPNETSPSVNVSTRSCTDYELSDTSDNLLSDFFSTLVSRLEGPPTICYEFNGVGSDIDANIMVEYEDRYGIRSVKLDDAYRVASILQNKNGRTQVEAIWRDDYGLVKLIARGDSSSGMLTGELRFYNFPSFEEALNQALEEAQEECRNGTKTVYECLGYTYPTHWWNQELYSSEGQRILDMIKEIMKDSSKYTVLGSIELDIGVSTWPE